MQNILAYVKKGTTPHSGNVVPLFLTPIVIFFIHGLHDLQEALHLSYAFREIERVILLRVIDRKWMEEIDDMEQLRQGIGMQAFAQRNPIDEYKMASYDIP